MNCLVSRSLSSTSGRSLHLTQTVKWLTVLFFVYLLSGCTPHISPEINVVLEAAGDNRSELETVLTHYRTLGDRQKLDAALWLISNMERHGFVEAAFYTEDKTEIAFSALDYPDYDTAMAVIDSLEDLHGPISYNRKRFVRDVDVMSADFLIEHIDLAFRAWREKPWAREISFDAFCEFILPYRGSNEPLSLWRAPCLDRLVQLPLQMTDQNDIKEAGELIRQEVRDWVGFSTLYYLHPTDQSYEEMITTGLGRCEDIGNMMSFAMRANAVLCANDYTPFWANRDNNHAWEVLLDPEGNGDAVLDNVAAKVYRKMFSIQPGNLGCIKHEDEKVPRWLAGKTYRDVTDSYVNTSDVTVKLTEAIPVGHRFAYLCVFNGGEWQAVQWGRINQTEVTFPAMGRDIAYLPAFFVDETLIPASEPFILAATGEIKSLKPDYASPVKVTVKATTPAIPDADTHTVRPRITIAEKSYSLYVWDKEWITVTEKKGSAQGEWSAESPCSGGLYWLVAEDSRRLERIFTVESDQMIFW